MLKTGGRGHRARLGFAFAHPKRWPPALPAPSSATGSPDAYGGPIWARKDIEAWSIPKGLVQQGEDPLEAALREFREETGFVVFGAYEPLGAFRQNSSKDLTVWCLEGDCEPEKLVSNTFEMVWPPKSKTVQTFPEADRAAWLDREEALQKIAHGQRPVLEAFYARMSKRAG